MSLQGFWINSARLCVWLEVCCCNIYPGWYCVEDKFMEFLLDSGLTGTLTAVTRGPLFSLRWSWVRKWTFLTGWFRVRFAILRKSDLDLSPWKGRILGALATTDDGSNWFYLIHSIWAEDVDNRCSDSKIIEVFGGGFVKTQLSSNGDRGVILLFDEMSNFFGDRWPNDKQRKTMQARSC